MRHLLAQNSFIFTYKLKVYIFKNLRFECMLDNVELNVFGR